MRMVVAPRKAVLLQVGGLLRRLLRKGSTQVPRVPHPGTSCGMGVSRGPRRMRENVGDAAHGWDKCQAAGTGGTALESCSGGKCHYY